MYRSSSPGLAGKKRQKTSSMSSKMIVVLPVPPAPIKRHACCARFRKGVLFSSSCKATSIASPNHLQADNCSGASLNPPADFSNAATFRAIAADGLLKVRHSASGIATSLFAASSTCKSKFHSRVICNKLQTSQNDILGFDDLGLLLFSDLHP